MQNEAGAAGAEVLGWSVKAIMIFGGVFGSLAMVAISSVLPAIDSALAHDPHDSLLVKQLMGGVGIAMMLGSLVAGFLVDRINVRAILATSIVTYVLSGTAGLYLSHLPYLLASRLVLGFSAAIIQITAFTFINTRLSPERRAHWMGVHIFAAMASTIVVQPVAGFIGDYSWRWPFALYALALLMLPAALLFRDTKPVQSARLVRGGTQPFGWAGFLRVFPYHYLLLAVLVGTIVFLPAIYVPFLFRERGMGDPSMIALVLTADSVAGALVSSQYGRVRRRISRHGAFMISFSIAATGTLVAGLSSGVVGIVAGMLFYGFGTGWFVPNLMTAIGEKLPPSAQARAVGLVKAAHFSSAGLAILVMEPVTRHYGAQVGLLLISALAALLAVLAGLRSMRPRPSLQAA